MSDYNLTPAEWRMARQAGAAFTQEDATEVTTQFGQQLALEGTLPQPGETYRNVHSGTIGTVTEVQQRRRTWVKMRHGNHVTELPLDWIGKHWLPCRPDGSDR